MNIYAAAGKNYFQEKIDPELNSAGSTASIYNIERNIPVEKDYEKNLKQRVKIETLLSIISTNFINCAIEEIDARIDAALLEIGKFARVDKSSLFRFEPNLDSASCTNEWCSGLSGLLKEKQKNIPAEKFPWLMKKLKKKEAVSFYDIKDLPAEAVLEREFYEKQGVLSSIIFPVAHNKKLIGFVWIYSVKEKRFWVDIDFQLLQALSEIFANSLERKKVASQFQKSEERFRSLINYSSDIITLLNKEGVIIYVSPSFEKVMGYKTGEVIGRSFFEYHAQEELEFTKNFFNNILKEPGNTIDEVIKASNASGKALYLECFATNLLNNPSVNAVVINSRDITQKINADKIADELAKLSNRLNAAVTAKEACLIIVDTAERLFGWHACSIDLYNSSENIITPVLMIDMEGNEKKEFPPATGTPEPSIKTKEVIEKGAQLILRNSEQLKRDLTPFGTKSRRSASIMMVPVKKEDHVVGIISIHSYNKNAYSREDMESLKRMANYCAGALERINIAQKLEQSEKKFRDIFQYAPVGIIQSTPEGKILTANNTAAAILGFSSAADIMRLNVKQFYLKPEDREAVIKTYGNDMLNNFIDVQWKGNDGRIIWVNISGHCVRDAGGKIKYFEGFFTDVTGAKLSNEKIKESEKRFKELADLLPQVIFETDLNGTITFTNKAGFEFFRYNEDDINRGFNISAFFTGADKQRALDNFQRSLSLNKIGSEEYTALRKDGTVFPVTVYSNVILKENKPAGIRGIVVDITERRKAFQEILNAKKKAEEANRLKSSFLSTMSHEIRTPLNAILGISDVLKDIYYERSDDEEKQFFDAMEDAGGRLLNTITQILDISRIEANDFMVKITRLSLTREIKAAYHLLKPFAESKNLSLKLNLPANEVMVNGDEYCLNGVILNILNNAIKYSEKGEVNIFINECSKGIKCIIKDEGIGISEEYQKHLFETFSQEDLSISRRYEGTGLGLAITKKYIDLMGGEITIKSEKQKGTEVVFILPKA